MATRKAEERIEKAHVLIMKHQSFCAWSGLLFIGTWKVVDEMPAPYPQTAGVNAAGDAFYVRTFMDGLKSHTGVDSELNFVVLHETGHKAMMHLSRGKAMWAQCPQLANIAADHVTNNMIHEIDPEEKFARMPRNPDGRLFGHRDPKYKGWSFHEVYRDLYQTAKKEGRLQPSPGGQGGERVSGCGDEFDGHDPSGGEGAQGDEPSDGEGTGKSLSEAQEKALAQKTEDALRSGSYLAGKMQGNAKRLVGDMLDAKIDWREQLQEFAMEACSGDDDATWRRVNRRFIGVDMYLPGTITEAVGEVVCAIDVSGSVGNAEMNACISEVVEVCRAARPSALRLIYWDDGITAEEVYTPEQYENIGQLTKPVGGGGTDVTKVAEYVNTLENIQFAIVLTDGYVYGGFGTWNRPVLWVMTTKVVAPIGKTIRLELD